MTNTILKFFGQDPVVAWLLTFALCCIVAALVVFSRAQLRAQRDRQADEAFRLKMRAMLPEPVQWPRPTKKTDQPWRRPRRSA